VSALPIEELTPREIVAALDRYIVGQAAAKRAVAVALRNRVRRQNLPEAEREDVSPKNILMIGPTGVGKTEIARRLAQLARAPFLKVEATKFTEVGYVGRDVDSIVRDLVAEALRLVEREAIEAALPAARVAALDRLVDLLDDGPPRKRRSAKRSSETNEDEPEPRVYEEPRTPIPDKLMDKAMKVFAEMGIHLSEQEIRDAEITMPRVMSEDDETPAQEEARRRRLRKQIESGKLDDREVDIETEDNANPFMQVFTPQGMEEMGFDIGQLGGGPRRTSRRMTVREARTVMAELEARRRLDTPSLHREAVRRAEQTGIVFLDEIDKVASRKGGSGPDVSREGVQRDLLPIIEGSTVATKFGAVRTDHVLFIAAGAFHMSRPSDLIPELQGRLPIRVELEPLKQADFGRILREPQNALTKQYQALLATDGVDITFTEDGLDELARLAWEVNQSTENIGARRLATLLERLLEDVLFEAPCADLCHASFDATAVRAKLGPLVQDADLSRYIL